MGLKQAVFVLAGIYCLTPFSSSAVALLTGVVLAILVGNPSLGFTKKMVQKLLPISIIGLGAGVNLVTVSRVGLHSIGYTFASIVLTLALGILLGRALRSEKQTSTLIAVGTAICGGSAIAAIAPVIRAKAHSITVALGTVFLLNSLALLVFPHLGHVFGLSQVQFGLWSALAIHDTSSVVGAGMQFGPEALKIATTVKLARALWIVPLTLGFAASVRRRVDSTNPVKPKMPYFILGFLLVAALVTYFPALQSSAFVVEKLAKQGLILTLFLIGSNLSWDLLKSVGLRPFLQGLLLWIVVSVGTLYLVLNGSIPSSGI